MATVHASRVLRVEMTSNVIWCMLISANVDFSFEMDWVELAELDEQITRA